MNDNWRRKELWQKHGEGFCVEVSHHLTTPLMVGPNCWCVYAYIYPAHPHFKKFDGDRMWQDAAMVLPLHGGPSFLRRHRDASGSVTSIQVGADYNHLGDDDYTYCDNAEDAFAVFSDADKLAEWLELPTEKS